MSETHFEVDWAHELGITVPRLWSEHPGHPFQLQNKKLIMERSEVYWKSRHLESLWADNGVYNN
jgi:hypothetical protein